ncbi:MAG: cytochrome b/b6 domain-containing protein [Thermoanaerobaculia bacterium]|jgi:cytochrome b
MNKVLVHDLPVRIFHWGLAISLVSAFAIAKLNSDESSNFTLHAIAGLVAALLVAMRIVWGLVGSRYARFGAFRLEPSELVGYLRNALGFGPLDRDVRHNPASSWFAIAAMLVVLGLGTTGIMVALGNKSVKDLHELLGWTLVALVASHIAGIALHSIRAKEWLAVSMISGNRDAEADAAIPSSRPLAGALFLILPLTFLLALLAGFDPAMRQLHLPILGTTLQVGDAPDRDAGGERAKQGEREKREERGDDD